VQLGANSGGLVSALFWCGKQHAWVGLMTCDFSSPSYRPCREMERACPIFDRPGVLLGLRKVHQPGVLLV
jgi:hypothetical protein